MLARDGLGPGHVTSSLPAGTNTGQALAQSRHQNKVSIGTRQALLHRATINTQPLLVPGSAGLCVLVCGSHKHTTINTLPGSAGDLSAATPAPHRQLIRQLVRQLACYASSYASSVRLAPTPARTPTVLLYCCTTVLQVVFPTCRQSRAFFLRDASSYTSSHSHCTAHPWYYCTTVLLYHCTTILLYLEICPYLQARAGALFLGDDASFGFRQLVRTSTSFAGVLPEGRASCLLASPASPSSCIYSTNKQYCSLVLFIQYCSLVLFISTVH